MQLRFLEKKIVSVIFASVFGASCAFGANLVNGISFFVNGEPVTLLDVYQTAQSARVDKEVAVDILVQKMLRQAEIKRLNLAVNDLEVDDEIARIAKQNKTTPEQMKTFLQERGRDWDAYRKELRENLLQRKLNREIASGSIQMVDNKEVLAYYQNNKEEFSIPQTIQTIKYYSSNQKSLEALVKSDGREIAKDIRQEPESLKTAALAPQVVAVFQKLPANSLTPIFPIDGQFVVFKILKKENFAEVPFDNVRNAVLQKMMVDREERLVNEHFEKLRANAKVNLIRLD